MTIDTQWRYKNTAVPTQTFENPEDFFDSLYTGAIDAEDIKKHKTGDTWFNNKYFGTTINAFETMFIKKNRINSELIDFYTDIFKS